MSETKENKIGLKSVEELLGMKFFIPSYQRGYRWTEQQVTELLNDISEFDNSKDGFYCLQPLVVKKREHNILSKIKTEAQSIDDVEKLLKGEWEVIDGQQRLTTIFIILSCMKKEGLYSLEYETRKDSATFLENIEDSQKEENIDYYHIARAKDVVQAWLSKNQANALAEKLLSNVRFIWYESVDEDPIKVFTRLNIGKISLTNAELIKALFLNRSNFITPNNEQARLRQQEIASEWDKIEYELQDDEFWLFLHNEGYDRPTRIDFIFDLICQQDSLRLEKEKTAAIGTDEYKTFRYFYEYFKRKDSNITLCWREVKTYYQVFKEWYDDLQLYHYVGYLIAQADEKLNVATLMQEWKKGQDKNSFVSYLKGKIRKTTSARTVEHQYKEDGSDKRNCRPILLFHNIQTVINQNHARQNNSKYQVGAFYKFPFHLYKLEKWDVEHINSSTENPEEDPASQKEWLLNMYLSAENETQEKIKRYFETKDESTQKALFEDIKKIFPQQKEWTPAEKNKIWNYALLDSSTNRSYGNAIFSGKRRVIIGKDKGKLIPIPTIKDGKWTLAEESDAKSSFVPPCTKQVFMKYYSPAVNHSNYWTTADAKAYEEDIKKCLNRLDEENHEQ